jgi:hypothetical protein
VRLLYPIHSILLAVPKGNIVLNWDSGEGSMDRGNIISSINFRNLNVPFVSDAASRYFVTDDVELKFSGFTSSFVDRMLVPFVEVKGPVTDIPIVGCVDSHIKNSHSGSIYWVVRQTIGRGMGIHDVIGSVLTIFTINDFLDLASGMEYQIYGVKVNGVKEFFISYLVYVRSSSRGINILEG